MEAGPDAGAGAVDDVAGDLVIAEVAGSRPAAGSGVLITVGLKQGGGTGADRAVDTQIAGQPGGAD
jgi:hypothetical protein